MPNFILGFLLFLGHVRTPAQFLLFINNVVIYVVFSNILCDCVKTIVELRISRDGNGLL